MTPGGAEKAPVPRWVRAVNWLSLLGGATGLVWLVLHVGLGTLGARLESVGGWFAAVVAVIGLSNLLDARIIQLLVRGGAGGAPLPYRRALQAQLAGHAVNQVMPGGNLGEVTKVTLLLQAGAPRGRAVSGVLLFNLAAVWVNLLVLGVGIPVIAYSGLLPAEAAAAMWAGGAVCAGFGVALTLLVGRGNLAAMPRALRRLRLLGAARAALWTARVAEVNHELARFRGERAGELRRALVLSVMSHLCSQSEGVLVMHALGVPLGPSFVLMYMAASMVVRWTAMVVPFGLGVSEGGHYALFDLFGVAPVVGLVLALVQRARQMVYAALGLTLLAWAQARVRAGEPAYDIKAFYVAFTARDSPAPNL